MPNKAQLQRGESGDWPSVLNEIGVLRNLVIFLLTVSLFLCLISFLYSPKTRFVNSASDFPVTRLPFPASR